MTVRIALLTTVYDHASTGAGTFVQYLRRAVREGLLDVTFFSDDLEQQLEDYERKVTVPFWASRLPGRFLVRGWSFHHAFLLEHGQRPFDLVWHNNVLTAWYSMQRRIAVPVVGMINDASNMASVTPWSASRDLGSYRAFVRFLWRFAERAVARRVDRVVVNSRFLKGRIIDAYDIPPELVYLLYKGVALDTFQYEERPMSESRLRVLFVKSDYVRGGLADLLTALAHYPGPVEVTIIGPPNSESTKIRALAAHCGFHDDVILLGSLSRREMVSQFAAHDVLCVPSRSEALGVVFLEALASGLPAVGTNVGGIPETLADGKAGWLVEPHNPEALAWALREVVTRDDERISKIRYGRAHVQQFSYDRMIQRFSEIAQEAVRLHSPPLDIGTSATTRPSFIYSGYTDSDAKES